MTIRDELETWARAGNVRGEVRKLARDSLTALDKLAEALEPFADAAKWFNATQSYLDDDCVAEREKHGLGTMRLNVGDLRRALAARETIRIPHDPVRRTRGGTPARQAQDITRRSHSMTKTHTIRIEPHPPVRGRKVIVVDGEQWGRIYMAAHGGQGNSFWFEQIGGGTICEPPKDGERKRERGIRVRGDKLARRAMEHGDPAPAPLAERLHAQAVDLVTRGLLRHPDVAKREQEERAARYRAQEETEARERRERDLTTAWTLIEEHGPNGDDFDRIGPAKRDGAYDKLAEAIADALNHARNSP